MPDVNMSIFEEVQRNQLVTEIDIQTQVALDDYQVQLSDIANPTQSQDNVVVDRFGEFLPHWNESLDFDAWVKISMEIAGKRLLVLRGNSSVSSASNGATTFNAFDIFDNLNDWTLTGTPTLSTTQVYKGTNSCLINADQEYASRTPVGVGIYTIMYYDNGDTTMQQILQHGIKVSSATKQVMFGYASDKNVNNYIYRYDGTYYDSGISRSVGWHELKCVMTGSEQKIYIDDTLVDTRSYDSGTENDIDMSFGDMWTGNIHGNGYWDQYIVRKYTATEPTWVANSEQNVVAALKSLGRAG